MTVLYDRVFRRVGPVALNAVSDYRTYLESLRRSQFLPFEELRRCQEQRLRQLCEYAFRHVPLFKQLGGKPDFGDPAELPILSKTVLKTEFRLATSGGLCQVFRRGDFTSGTTGVPLRFWTDRRSDGLRLASRYLFDEWIDLSFGSRTARIILNPSRFSRLVANELHIPHGSVTSRTAPEVLERVFRFQPECVASPPYALGLLAEARPRIQAKPSKPLCSIVSTGDDLLQSQRTPIERSFECKLYNRYGLREISGYIAQECKVQRGLHINVEHVMLEIVDEGGIVLHGEPGRIVITDLHNHVMPLIRYDTGDVGILSTRQCTCGITWPLLEVIQGRQRDYVVLKDGSRIHLGIIADSFLHHFSGTILQVQFVERDQGSMIIRMVRQKRLTQTDVTKVEAYFGKLFSSFDLEFTRDLSPDMSGKIPLLVREVDNRTPLVSQREG